MPGLAGRRALVKVSGDPVAFVDEATTNQGDNKTYQITNAAKRVWHPTNAIVVEKDTVPQSATLYTLNRLTGKVTFAADQGAPAVITVTGDYLPTSVAAGVRAYSFEITAGIVDNTDFDSANSDGGMPQKLQGLLDFSGTIGKRWRTDMYFRTAILAGATVVIEFYALRTQAYDLIAWAVLDRESLQAAVEGSVDVDVSFKGMADNEGRVVSLP